MPDLITIRNYLQTHDQDLAALCDLDQVTIEETGELEELAAQFGCQLGLDPQGEVTFPASLLRLHFNGQQLAA